MKEEINHYNINNPDGANKIKYSESRTFFKNDNPRYVQEDSTADLSEWDSSVLETPDIGDRQIDNIQLSSESGNNGADGNTSSSSSSTGSSSASSSASSSSASSAASSSASSAASTAASSAGAATSAAAAGSVGAVAGTVAASVAATVVVVAAFVSTLVIDISLVMATMFSLVFQINMTGAQEEDFINPIVAVLEDNNGFYREQEITADTIYITFDGLEPNTEYFITVKSEEKTFVNKKSYFTASEDVSNGSVTARYEGNNVFLSVKDVVLKAGEYYTVQAKDDSGNVVFAKDDIENKDFSFTVDKPVNLRFTLSIGGKVYAVTEIVAQPKTPAYDFDNGVWKWASDNSSASIEFKDLRGGEPLTVAASVTEQYYSPTCEEDGYTLYSATAVYGGKSYVDSKKSVDLDTATGHDYGKLIPEVSKTCETDGNIAYYLCGSCGKYFDEEHNEIAAKDIIIKGGHEYVYVKEVPADCEYEGFAAHYYCDLCETLFDENYNEVAEEDLIISAIGVVGAPELLTSSNLSSDYAGRHVYLQTEYDNMLYGVKIGALSNTTSDISDLTAFYIESVSGSDVVLYYLDGAEVKYLTVKSNSSIEFNSSTANALTVNSNGSLDASSGNYGYRLYYDPWGDKGIYMTNAASSDPAVHMYLIPLAGHTYGELIPENYEGNGLRAHYECSRCGKYFDENKVETTAENLIISSGQEQDANISLHNGRVFINSEGFAYGDNENCLNNSTPFVSSKDNPYVIENQEKYDCDNIISVYQQTSADIYIKLKDVTIGTKEWASLFRIVAGENATVNINLIIEGNVYFSVYGQSIFSSQGDKSSIVNIIIDQTNGHFEYEYDGEYSALSGSAGGSVIHVTGV